MTIRSCRSWLPLTTLATLLYLVANNALSADCDSALVPNVEQTRADYSLAVASLQFIDEKEFEERKKGAKGGMSVYDDLFRASADYQEFQKRVREYLSIYAFAKQETSARAYLKTYLSDAALAAWSKCMTGRYIVAAYARNVTSSGLTLRVDWNPPPAVTEPQVATLEVPEGGTIRGKTTVHENWQGNVSKSYPITRTAGQDVRVVVNVANQSDDFVVSSPKQLKEPVITIRVSGSIDHGSGARMTVQEQRVGYNFTLNAPNSIRTFSLRIAQFVDGKACPEASNIITPEAINFPAGTSMNTVPELRDWFQNGCQVAGGKVIQCFVDPMRFYKCNM